MDQTIQGRQYLRDIVTRPQKGNPVGKAKLNRTSA
jgi:hypothetical protein